MNEAPAVLDLSKLIETDTDWTNWSDETSEPNIQSWWSAYIAIGHIRFGMHSDEGDDEQPTLQQIRTAGLTAILDPETLDEDDTYKVDVEDLLPAVQEALYDAFIAVEAKAGEDWVNAMADYLLSDHPKNATYYVYSARGFCNEIYCYVSLGSESKEDMEYFNDRITGYTGNSSLKELNRSEYRELLVNDLEWQWSYDRTNDSLYSERIYGYCQIETVTKAINDHKRHCR